MSILKYILKFGVDSIALLDSIDELLIARGRDTSLHNRVGDFNIKRWRYDKSLRKKIKDDKNLITLKELIDNEIKDISQIRFEKISCFGQDIILLFSNQKNTDLSQTEIINNKSWICFLFYFERNTYMYNLLNTKVISEDDFNYSDFPYSFNYESSIFFISKNIKQIHEVNIKELLFKESNSIDSSKLPHKIGDSDIECYKLTDFEFLINVRTCYRFGYLRDQDTSFCGIFNFNSKTWSNVEQAYELFKL